MKECLQSVSASISGKVQLQVLLKKTNTMVVFKSENERGHLFLSLEETHTNRNESCSYIVTISGAKEYIEEALIGKVPLRLLQKRKQLEIQGSFRQILLLESILLLSKDKNTI